MSNNVEVKTLTIKRIANDVLNSDNEEHKIILNEFLSEKPILTNYFMSEQNSLILGKRNFIQNVLNRSIGPSSKTFYCHINVVDLTDECKVTLSPHQVKMIEQVL